MRLGLLLLAVIGSGCGSKSSAIAELLHADGLVDRRTPSADWSQVERGEKYFIGDSARTSEHGGADFVLAGGAKLHMQPSSTLHFGGQGSKSKIIVEVGGVDVSGTGDIGLGIGNLKISNATVAITANTTDLSQIKLVVGKASVTTAEARSNSSMPVTRRPQPRIHGDATLVTRKSTSRM